MGTIEPRVAPTVKITDDAPMTGPMTGSVSAARPSQAVVPLFPPVGSGVDVMPRTVSQPPGYAPPSPQMPRTMSSPPEMPRTDMPRTVSQPPGLVSAPVARAVSQPPIAAAAAGPARAMSQPPVSSRPHASPPAGTAAVVRESPPAGARPSAPLAKPASKPATKPVVRTSTSSLRGDSGSGPAGGRNWPLIVILVILDLGLAGSGALLLARGLAEPDAPTVSTTSPPHSPPQTQLQPQPKAP